MNGVWWRRFFINFSTNVIVVAAGENLPYSASFVEQIKRNSVKLTPLFYREKNLQISRLNLCVNVSFSDGCFPQWQTVLCFLLTVNVIADKKKRTFTLLLLILLLFFVCIISKRERKKCLFVIWIWGLLSLKKEEQCKNPFVWQKKKMPHYLILLGMIVL